MPAHYQWLFSSGDSYSRRPPDLLDVENSTPEQLSADSSEEDRTTLELKRIALRAHQEARQSLDLRKDLARRVMPSDGPYSKGDRVFVWMKDESKKKTEGIWVRGKVVSQEGAMVLVEVTSSCAASESVKSQKRP